MSKTPKKMPWEKELSELNKYDWLTAVGVHPVHKNCPLDLRVANAIMQKADIETCLMWATQQTISQFAGASDERKVRTAVSRLESTGALVKKRIANLQEDTLAALGEKMSGNRNKRGVVYTLRLFWAMETFEAYVKKQASEPLHLLKGREEHRTMIVRHNRTAIVRSEQDYDSPTNTTDKHYTDTNKGLERDQDLASTREGGPYAKATGGW